MLLLRCKEEARDEEPISHLSKDQDAETIDVSRSFFRTFGLSDFRTSGLPDFRTSGLSDFRTFGLPDFRTSGLIYKIKTSSSSVAPQ